MKIVQCKKYIEVAEENQQLRFKIHKNFFTKTNSLIYQASAQLEKLDYTELYRAYSEGIRKSQVEPKVLFKVLVCAYLLQTNVLMRRQTLHWFAYRNALGIGQCIICLPCDKRHLFEP